MILLYSYCASLLFKSEECSLKTLHHVLKSNRSYLHDPGSTVLAQFDIKAAPDVLINLKLTSNKMFQDFLG